MSEAATGVTTGRRRLQPNKAFQRLWVAGTLGAFFTTLARTLPGDLHQLVYEFNPGFALNVVLRYGYQLWLIWYFFLSNLRSQNDDPPKKHEVPYDVVQSVCGLIAAYYLGFLVSPNLAEHPYGTFHGILAYLAPNGAICVICFLAWLLFREKHLELQTPRLVGAGIGAASLVLVVAIRNGPWWSVSTLLLSLAVLLWPLRKFHRTRVQETREPGLPAMGENDRGANTAVMAKSPVDGAEAASPGEAATKDSLASSVRK
jgi:hypothetical protein